MANAAKLRMVQPGDAPPPRTPEREVLAGAIAKRDTLAADVARAVSLLSMADDTLTDLQRARVRAAKVAEGARTKFAEHALQVQLGQLSEDDAPISPPVARRKLEESEDALEVQRVIRGGLFQSVGELKSAHSYAADAVRAAALRVLSTMPAVQEFAEDVGRLQREVMAKSLTLVWLSQGVWWTSNMMLCGRPII